MSFDLVQNNDIRITGLTDAVIDKLEAEAVDLRYKAITDICIKMKDYCNRLYDSSPADSYRLLGRVVSLMRRGYEGGHISKEVVRSAILVLRVKNCLKKMQLEQDYTITSKTKEIAISGDVLFLSCDLFESLIKSAPSSNAECAKEISFKEFSDDALAYFVELLLGPAYEVSIEGIKKENQVPVLVEVYHLVKMAGLSELEDTVCKSIDSLVFIDEDTKKSIDIENATVCSWIEGLEQIYNRNSIYTNNVRMILMQRFLKRNNIYYQLHGDLGISFKPSFLLSLEASKNTVLGKRLIEKIVGIDIDRHTKFPDLYFVSLSETITERIKLIVSNYEFLPDDTDRIINVIKSHFPSVVIRADVLLNRDFDVSPIHESGSHYRGHRLELIPKVRELLAVAKLNSQSDTTKEKAPVDTGGAAGTS